MKTQHTPGPWHIEKHQKIVWQDSGGPGNQTYATQYPIMLIVHEQLGDPRLRTCVCQLDHSTESEGNARLIAQAPAMLEALNSCIHAVDLALCGTPSAHYFNELKAKLGGTGYTLEDNLKQNMADIKGACTKAHKSARAVLARIEGKEPTP